jgi:hypothetical protein
LVRGALGWREVGADQVFIDLDQLRPVGVDAIEDQGANRLVSELAHCFEPVVAGNEDMGAVARALA